MKKELRQLVLPIAILGVLIAALVIYLVVDAVKKNNLDKDLAQVSITVAAQNEIAEMRIDVSENEYMSFSFNADGSVSGADHNGTKFDQTQVQQSTVKNLRASMSELSLVRELESPSSDMSLYGLDPYKYKVTLTMKDGGTRVLYFGNTMEDKSGIYAKQESSSAVLITKITYFENLSLSFENYLNLRAVALLVADVDSIAFSRNSAKEKIVVKPQEEFLSEQISQTNYKVIEPIERDSLPAMKTLMDKILLLDVTNFLNIPEADYASFGLDQPEYEFNFRLKSGKEEKLFLSKELNGFYYGYTSDNPYCFKINAASIPGLTLPMDELMDYYVAKEYLDTVRSAKVTMKEGSFEVEYSIDESTKSILSDNSSLRVNQRDAKVFARDGSCYAVLLFESIFRMKIDHIDKEAKPQLSEPEVTITIQPVSGSVYSVKLQKLDSDYYYCFINDIYSGFIVNRSVLYRDNGQYLSGFGIWDAYQLVNEAIDNKDVDGYYNRADKGNTDA